MEPVLWITGYLLCGVVTAAIFIHIQERDAEIDPNSDDDRFPVTLLVVAWVLVAMVGLFTLVSTLTSYAVKGCLTLIKRFWR